MQHGKQKAFHTTQTYQVNAMDLKGFSPTEVLLDNQANIYIIRLELLRALQPVNQHVKVKGVGGIQLEVQQARYLEDFFEVYASN
jgi:hypothetical protein